MRLIPRALVAAAAGLGLALSGVAPAVAAPAPSAVHVVTAIKAKPVTIKTIPTKTVSGAAKATVKPSFARAKGVSKVKAVITVKKGSKTVVKAKSSAKLAAGTYKVTTKVNYVYKGKKASVSKTQTLKVVKKAASVAKTVTPGAFCSGAGSKGVAKNGHTYTCKTSSTDSRKRWRR